MKKMKQMISVVLAVLMSGTVLFSAVPVSAAPAQATGVIEEEAYSEALLAEVQSDPSILFGLTEAQIRSKITEINKFINTYKTNDISKILGLSPLLTKLTECVNLLNQVLDLMNKVSSLKTVDEFEALMNDVKDLAAKFQTKAKEITEAAKEITLTKAQVKQLVEYAQAHDVLEETVDQVLSLSGILFKDADISSITNLADNESVPENVKKVISAISILKSFADTYNEASDTEKKAAVSALSAILKVYLNQQITQLSNQAVELAKNVASNIKEAIEELKTAPEIVCEDKYTMYSSESMRINVLHAKGCIKVSTSTDDDTITAIVDNDEDCIDILAGTAGTSILTITNFGVTKQVKFVIKNPKLSVTKKTLKVGKSFKLKVKQGSVESVATFKSTNSKVVKVTKAGKVTALKKGTATIKVTFNKDPYLEGVTLKCKVTVK